MTVLSARQDERYASTSTRQQLDARGRDVEQDDQLPKLSISHEVLNKPELGRLLDTEPRGRELWPKDHDTRLSGLAISANRKYDPFVERIRPQRTAQQRSIPLQQWEGTVAEVSGDSFGANLRNLTDPAGPGEFATILFEELDEEDKRFVRPGAVFYWSIGYLIEPYGQRHTATTIYFRRLPGWSVAALERAKRAAEGYRDIFSDDLSE